MGYWRKLDGFGAVRLGLKYPDRFYSIWSHSGVFPEAHTLSEHWYWSGKADDLDCYQLINGLNVQAMPHLSFDCGTEDHLLDHNRRFHAFLEKRGIPHQYREYRGSLDWDYWDAQIPEALQQHISELK